jgi:translocation and assembly module TamB
LDKIRGAIGVDVLTFAPGASESELGRLKAGKYVRDDLFVGVEQGTTAGSTRSIVEWHLTPKVTVEGTVGSSSESTLGIQRRWEY